MVQWPRPLLPACGSMMPGHADQWPEPVEAMVEWYQAMACPGLAGAAVAGHADQWLRRAQTMVQWPRPLLPACGSVVPGHVDQWPGPVEAMVQWY
jgi:hypothetical protein